MKKIFLALLVSSFAFSVFAVEPEMLESIESKLILMNAGSFEMGSKEFEKNETPVRTISLKSFYILNTEVTQEEYKAVIDHNYSNNKGEKLPVEEVSWYDAVIFCNKLSVASGLNPVYSLNGNTNADEWGDIPRMESSQELKDLWKSIVCDFNANGYRLPTEAEWEYAAGGNSEIDFASTAWYKANSDEITHAVAEQSANKNGLYDMNGNVWEWCQDWYSWYTHADGVNDVDNSGRKIRRGGSVLSDEVFCRNANRASSVPELRGIDLGFRVVRANFNSEENLASSAKESNSLSETENVNEAINLESSGTFSDEVEFFDDAK